MIGQLQGTIFRSALIQGTILIVPVRNGRQHAYCAICIVDIIHVLHNYVVTRSFMNCPLFVYQSESVKDAGIRAADIVLHAAAAC